MRADTVTRLLSRSLPHYWRTNLAVVAGVATSVAVLAGALLVGQSVRASLRDLLNERIGATDYLVAADRFFGEELAAGLVADRAGRGRAAACPIVAVRGVLINEASRRQAFDVGVFGVDERFWRFHGMSVPPGFGDRGAIVGEPLASQIGVRAGDGLLLRIENEQDVPGESLFGRREDTSRTIRLTCGGIAAPERLGEFALRPGQGTVFSVFVPLARLQRDLSQTGRANAILLSGLSADDEPARLRQSLHDLLTPADVGLRFRALAGGQGVAVESTRILLDEGIARAAFDEASASGQPASGVFAYLANAIRARGREIPYSVVAAADLGRGTLRDVTFVAGSDMSGAEAAAAAPPPIWLNDWAWKDLGVAIGEAVTLEYYSWEGAAGLVTRTAPFTLAGVVATGGDVDATLTPDVPGVTGARTLRAWDPPFPLDLRRIRPADEEYWERFRSTPKAFVSLAVGQSLWQSRFGRLTAVRVAAPESTVAAGLRRRIAPEAAGFTVSAVRRDGVTASTGAVNLGEYFLYFSAFLIAAAVLLSASFFKLGVEQRVREIGVLRAVGFPATALRTLFLLEGAILLAAGGLVGAAGALGYGGALMAGLRTWWVGAVGTNRLSLHVSWGALAAGCGIGAFVSMAAIVWTLRGLARNSPRSLLAGQLESRAKTARQARTLTVVVVASMVAAVSVLGASAAAWIPGVEGFFGGGTLLLVATVSLAALVVRRRRPRPITGSGWRALTRLAFRGAAHRPARSLIPVVLIAAATFVIVSVEAFRKDAGADPADRRSGTGGYAAVARAALPVITDPGSAAGRDALGIGAADAPELADARMVSFRERPGDDASCLNLYAPLEPAVLGAPRSFVKEGRFSFAKSAATTAAEQQNPWLLLDKPLDGAVVPAIADANSLEYSLHRAVGDEIVVRGGTGAPVRLRIVAALRDSILQGVVIISETQFLRAFPAQQGYRFFLVEAPRDRVAPIVLALNERLAVSGMRVESSGERLAGFHRVENTYLSTFQSLGALGLVLGTVGLLAVLLRNVMERRAELALLRAMGYRQVVLAAMMVAEHVLLLLVGLACGTVSALVAIAPALAARGGALPVGMVGLLLLAVTGVGLISSVVGGLVVLRAPLVAALRSE